MKWLDLYPDILPSSGSSSPVGSGSKTEFVSDGSFAEVPDLPDELQTIPLYAWILPARKIPKKYNELFSKHGIPLLE